MSDNISLRGDIRGNFPPTGTCIWCGSVAWTTAITPFRLDLGEVPLHMFCAVEIRQAYQAWKDGTPMEPNLEAGMRRLATTMAQWPALTEGVTP